MSYIVRPKKSLGQHFLIDLNIAQAIADTLDNYKNTPILEVGPGMGVLTQYLLSKGHDLTVVELDHESIEYLQENFPELKEHILEEDFLKLDLSKLFSGNFCVIGNYPYNISSQIFFKVLEHKDHIPCCSGMIQKEVAERMAAPPGSKTYGILSVLLQAWYEIEYLFTVPEHVFKRIVKTAFNQRRKTMRNSLKSMVGQDCKILAEPIFNERPERLSVKQFIDLTNLLESYIIK